MVAAPNPPTLWVMGLDEVDYHTESTGGARWRFIIQGFASTGVGSVEAQDIVDGWISNEGALSVKAALEDDPTLGGLVDDLIVRSSSGHLVFVIPELGGRVGSDWTVDVYT